MYVHLESNNVSGNKVLVVVIQKNSNRYMVIKRYNTQEHGYDLCLQMQIQLT